MINDCVCINIIFHRQLNSSNEEVASGSGVEVSQASTQLSVAVENSSATRSITHQNAQTVQALLAINERTTRSRFRKVAPPAEKKRLTLAILPTVEVVISNDWKAEKIINRRICERTGKYEYLVAYKGKSVHFNTWKSTDDIATEELSHMVPEYTNAVDKLTSKKLHLQA